MTIIPTGSTYENIINKYLGVDFADTVVGFVKEKDVLWSRFLKVNGLTPTDPRVTSGTDATILEEFVAFVAETYQSMQYLQLSPDERARRRVVFSALELIIMILELLQQNVALTGQQVVFLNKYSGEYSDMMAREADAFYVGGSRSTPEPNNSDLSKWTLGFDDITMNEYLQTVIASGEALEISSIALTAPPAPNIQQNGYAILTNQLTSPVVPTNKLSFTRATDGNSITFKYTYGRITGNTAQPPSTDIGTIIATAFGFGGAVPSVAFTSVTETTESLPVTFSPTDSFADRLLKAEQAFKAFLQTTIPNTTLNVYNSITQSETQTIRSTNYTFTRVLTMPWTTTYNQPYTHTTDSEQHAKEQAASRRRADKNSLLQQYITNSQTQMQILSNRSDAANSQQQQAQTGTTQAASFFNTVIGQLSTILTSIFQVSS